MLNEFLFTKIEEQDIGNTPEATIDVLRPVFEDRIISRRVDVVWPPRSCDFTPLGYYLWGAVKDKCYAHKPERIDALKNNIRETIGEEENIGNIWFQQDGATCHTAKAILDIQRPVFEDRIISRRADNVWPPRNYDLTPLDYYLWCAVKDKCYANKPMTIDALKDNIPEAIGEIQLHTIDNVLKNQTNRVGYFMASRGSHLNEIIFHY